ncbi:hypothetical protein [Demequina subtropica]|uniref:hypothetical protein n=1 Tax=Demequina subtropica TaxID=1638989 RepID=UPI0007841EB2|nr:hypothetical protein [Demequina subtropica]
MSSGATPAARAATDDTSEPLSLRLLGRGSAAGAAVIAAIVLLYVGVLPALAGSVSAPAPPRIVDIGQGASIRVTEDWSVGTDAPNTVTLTQGGATLVIAAPVESDLHPAQAITMVTDTWLEQGQGDLAVTGSPRAFSTDAGDDAVTSVLQDPLRAGQAWVVSDGTHMVVALLSMPQTGWEAASDSAQTIVRSIVLPTQVQP